MAGRNSDKDLVYIELRTIGTVRPRTKVESVMRTIDNVFFAVCIGFLIAVVITAAKVETPLFITYIVFLVGWVVFGFFRRSRTRKETEAWKAANRHEVNQTIKESAESIVRSYSQIDS